MANEPRNLTTKTTMERMAGLLSGFYAKKSYVDEKVAAAISSTYKPGGTKTAAELTSALLVAANEGLVYNLSTVLTITDDNKALFTENAEGTYPVGTNVAVINTGTAETPSFKFDVLAGFVDLSNYVQKASGVTGDIVKLTEGGSYEDTGILASEVAVKPATAATDNLAAFDANQNAVDSGIAKADVQQKLAAGAFTSGNIRTNDANGFAQDGGIAASDIVVASDIVDYTEAELRTLLGLPAAE